MWVRLPPSAQMEISQKAFIRLPTHVRPERYEIILHPDLNNFTFNGEETITLIIDKPTKTITLHAVELDIESAEFISRSDDLPAQTGTWAGDISYNEKAETATFAFPQPLVEGKGQLKLHFRGILNDKMRGFYRSRYVVNGTEKHLATTQFEATDARRAFPGFDEPAHKAIFDITLIVPGNTTAISNTVETNIKEHQAGLKIVKFAPTPRMSTYLLAFITGEFESIETRTKNGVLVRVFVVPGRKEQARFALETASKILDFYEDYFNIPYPLPALDLIAIPDFTHGAMENWGAVTYRESTLLFDEKHSSLANKQWVALVIAHELAHMWFGDLVTMKWWSDLWLNEGFASFIEYVAIDNLFPQWDIWTQFIYLENGTALALDSLKNTHPIEVNVHHPSEISEIFDKVSYSKGAAIIRMLANYLGEETFRKGISHYLKKHAYANAKTADLWQALEEVSKKPVKKIMTNWTRKAGYPVIRLQVTGGRLQLTQSRFFSSQISQREAEDHTTWSIPIKTQNSKLKTQNYILNLKSIDIPQSSDKEWMKLNSGETSFVRINYPAKQLELLSRAVSQKKLGSVDRLGIVRDAFDLARAGELSTVEALKLARHYETETDYTVWMELSLKIDKLASLLAHEKFYEQYRSFCRLLFAKIAAKMGWKKRVNEAHTQTLLRSLALYHFGTYGDKKTINTAQKLFMEHHREKKVLDPDLRGVVYNLVAENGDKKEYQALLSLYQKTELAQEKDRIIRPLAMFCQSTFLEKTLAWSLSKEVRAQDTVRVITAVFGNPKGQELAWRFVKRNWQTLLNRYRGGGMLPRLVSAAEDFVTNKDARDVEAFFTKNLIPEVKRTVAQVLEQILANAAWLSRDKDKIALFLKP
ncbi:M1 family metallopeptidase [Candidatus Microgenomates bacterium]|nr:M1 family metallopeptidase [Candidatus Microgenomates bacterium]